MKACPLKFDHPSEAQQLHGLGPKLCDRLVDKLKAHCAANGLPMPQLPHRGKKRQSDDEENGETQLVKKARKVKPYVPALRSGAYALVLALATLDENNTQGLTKTETIELAQPHCDSSFTAPSDPTKFYTAWNSIKTLVGKDLVYERGRPLKRYMLTDDGWEVARRMQGIEEGAIPNLLLVNNQTVSGKGDERSNMPAGSKDTVAKTSRISSTRSAGRPFNILDLSSSPEPSLRHPSRARLATARQHSRSPEKEGDHNDAVAPAFAPILLPAGSFTVHLVLDTREVRTKTDRDYISEQLNKSGVKPISRALPLGDALWIAKLSPGSARILTSNNTGDEGEGNDEIMLDYIVERKRLDDLIGSIKDGRFHEQKFRLRRSGVNNVTYIIEDFSISAENEDKYGEAVSSAIASTQVVNNYFVKQTAKLDDTIRYLARMTKMLQTMYEKQDLRIIPTKVIQAKTYLPLVTRLREEHPSKGHFITFSAFSALCGKSDTMTLRDVFLKMLMCTRGVTGEKALEIQRRWKTPSEFIGTFESREDQKVKDTMVSEKLGALIPRKKIAKGLSGKIAEVWG
jgi:crossover junction endonuclease MUS81